jgi:hypothetical protein
MQREGRYANVFSVGEANNPSGCFAIAFSSDERTVNLQLDGSIPILQIVHRLEV